ncbi:MAG: glycoside hydrolase family 3 protein [Clostridia bacterium]|nr:glycoside hydrolase family 3 protein [Clostridia bacterium]
MKKPLLSELTLEQKIGQLLLGYQWDICRKTEIDHNIFRTWEEREDVLRKEKYGSLWAQTGTASRGTDMAEFSHGEVDKSSEYGAFLQRESDCYEIPALTCLDAEASGAGPLFWDLTTTCPPLAMGATNDEELVYEMGAAIARELRCAGVNWRWTPVVDLCGKYTHSVIRSYSPHDTDKQVRLALAHARGMQSEGVAATAKHFPGGAGPAHEKIGFIDSHFCSHSLDISKEEWQKEAGSVFQRMIDGGIYSIMISHRGFPAVDNSVVNGRIRPSTISKKVITDLLKNEMGFDGVVITDGIQMASLYTLMPYEDLIVEIVNAGNDVILGVQPNTGEIIKQAVLDGRISIDRINDGCRRVLDMKEKLGLFDDGYRLVKSTSDIEAPKTREVNMKVARKAVTLIRDRENILPFSKDKVKNVTIIVSTHADYFIDKLQPLKKEFEDRGAQVTIQRRLVNNEALAEISEKNDLIIYATYVGPHEPMGPPSLFGDELKTYLHAFTSGKEKTIGVSFGYPYMHHFIMQGADAFINTYSVSAEMMKALAETIYGEIPFEGESPVDLNM